MSVTQSSGLLSASILIFHPDPLIGMMIDEVLVDAGFSDVCFVTSVEGAAMAMRENRFDAAVLGFNNHNEELLPIARHLKGSNVPFIVCGALSELPKTDGLNQAPIVSALADAQELTAALNALGIISGPRPPQTQL